MPKDTIVKAIETMLGASPSAMQNMMPRIKKLMDKAKKDKGKPKGRSPSMILGSASKAGMQGKQGNTFPRRKRSPLQKLPGIGSPTPKRKTNGRTGNMVEEFYKKKIKPGSGRRG